MIDNNDSASALPIKDEAELAIEARAQQLMRQYEISMEEALRMARGEMLGSMEAPPKSPRQPAQPTGVSAEERLVAAHEAVGMPVDRARRLARNQVGVYGEQGANEFADRRMTPEGREFGAAAWAEQQQADARHQRMYDDYFSATGAPSHQTVPAAEAARDEYRQRYNALFDSYQRDGLHPQQPIDPGTPEQNERWDAFLENNPEQMARFRPDDYAAMEAAQRDQQMADSMPLLVKRYGPEEAAKVAAARKAGRVYVPNTKEQRERNQVTEDLVTTAMQGNTASRAFLQQRDKRRMDYVARPRQLRELGLAPDLNGPRLNAALGLAETATQSEADARIRNLLRGQRQGEREEKDMLWRPRTMIRAGNAIGAMHLPGADEWDRAAIVGGPTPLDVKARSAEMAARMAQQAVTGFLANTPASMNPMQQAAAQQQLATNDAAQRQDMMNWAENYVSTNFAEPQGAMNYLSRGARWLGLPVHDVTEFTAAEQQAAIDALMARYPHMTLAQAQGIIDSVADTRTSAPRERQGNAAPSP